MTRLETLFVIDDDLIIEESLPDSGVGDSRRPTYTLIMIRGVLAVLAVLAFAVAGCQFLDESDGPTPKPPGDWQVGFGELESHVFGDNGVVVLIQLYALTSGEARLDIPYTVTSPTATHGIDFVEDSGVVTFSPGERIAYIRVTINANVPPELEELVEVRVKPPRGWMGADVHLITINEAPTPTVGVAPMGYADESFDDVISVVVDYSHPMAIAVDYAITGGTASSADYVVVAGTLTFTPGEWRKDIRVTVIDDQIAEDDETIVVTLSNPVNATLRPTSEHVFTINDNEPRPMVVFANPSSSILEGDSGAQATTIEVKMLGTETQQTVTVPFSISSGTASSPSDYTIVTPSPLTFPPGIRSQLITIAVNGDSLNEGSEMVRLDLGTPTNASRSTEGHVLTIANDECYGTGNFGVCLDALPNAPIALSGIVYTDSNSQCLTKQPVGWVERGQSEACFIVATDVTVGSVRAVGVRPLVLVASNTLLLNGLLDVSTQHDAAPGAGSQPSSCTPFGSTPGPGAGGAGGSFMTVGGNGGGHSNPIGTGGIAGTAETNAPNVLRGGCIGQDGHSATSLWRSAGRGGGVVYLVASSITLASGAVINASGEGASGLGDLCGGHGGGSGGMSVLDAPTIIASGATLLANGGGGSEGCDGSGYGTDGSDPNPSTPFLPAAGGLGNPGGNGGSGFAEGSPATSGAGAINNSGGGGGGGGAGYIKSSVPLANAALSPSL